MKIKSITEVKNLENKRVLLRADFNVPIEKGKIKDDYKILRGLTTIKFLIKNRAKLIILTHLGEPAAGRIDKKYSVKPIAKKLSEYLKQEVKLTNGCIGLSVGTAISHLQAGEVLLLENIRFEKGEKENSRQLAKDLSELADLYVNDAFAVSHRPHASVSAIKKFLPAYAGWLLEQEIINLRRALNPDKPLVAVLGGAKISTKIKVIKRFRLLADKILIGGALANNFFLARGLDIGSSLFDRESLRLAEKLNFKNIILPVDVLVRRKDGRIFAKKPNLVMKSEAICDIGPKTINLFSSFLKKAKTIFWNGPLGLFEDRRFKHGTLALGKVIAARSRRQAYGVVGGGETIEALRMTEMIEYVDWVSTGGGAMLSFLSGEKMPGLTKIVY